MSVGNPAMVDRMCQIAMDELSLEMCHEFRALSRNQLHALLLVDVYGLTEQEAADVTGRQRPHVARSLIEAKNILKAKMFREDGTKAA